MNESDARRVQDMLWDDYHIRVETSDAAALSGLRRSGLDRAMAALETASPIPGTTQAVSEKENGDGC